MILWADVVGRDTPTSISRLKEWVLGGNASVSYQPAIDLREAIEYDLSREKEFDYSTP